MCHWSERKTNRDLLVRKPYKHDIPNRGANHTSRHGPHSAWPDASDHYAYKNSLCQLHVVANNNDVTSCDRNGPTRHPSQTLYVKDVVVGWRRATGSWQQQCHSVYHMTLQSITLRHLQFSRRVTSHTSWLIKNHIQNNVYRTSSTDFKLQNVETILFLFFWVFLSLLAQSLYWDLRMNLLRLCSILKSEKWEVIRKS